MITLKCGPKGSRLESIDVTCDRALDMSLNKTDYSFEFVIPHNTVCKVEYECAHSIVQVVTCNRTGWSQAQIVCPNETDHIHQKERDDVPRSTFDTNQSLVISAFLFILLTFLMCQVKRK